MFQVLENPDAIERPFVTPVLYSNYSEVPWDYERWPNFRPDEPNLYCPLTGEFYFDEQALDALQQVRTMLGRPVHINSGHRSPIHNAMVGGKALSEHKRIAFDIDLSNHPDRQEVFQACLHAGFTGFGFYQTFIHIDRGQPRSWFGNGARGLWIF